MKSSYKTNGDHMSAETILIVDDEQEMSDLLTLFLNKEGFKVISTDQPLEVFGLLEAHRPDLILLDIVMPGMNGLELCERLRSYYDVPILFISCRDEDADIIEALGIGGDDYMVKPFSPLQLTARVKAHLRRSKQHEAKGAPDILSFDNLTIDFRSCSVTLDGNPLILSSKEYDILALLARNPDHMYSFDELYKQVWKRESLGDTRTLLVHISNLRKKMETDPAHPRWIVTIRRYGYKFGG
ncbi:response regulator transcription factor [Paenibacillus sp. 1P07SE]|uniref:response regulator transcription factor n=1 Tax=Paenibacillus sp. 1P07SE TaxID=3132209 RepID=UPI0039A6A468